MTQQIKSPGLSVQINGSHISVDEFSRIREISLDEELSTPAHFSMTYAISDFRDGAWHGVDAINIGDSIKISFGFNQELKFDGYITTLEPSFERDAKMTIRGYDPLYKLQFGTRTRSFTYVTDSEVVQTVLETAGIPTGTIDSMTMPHEYVLQDNVSDFEFIKRRAAVNFFDFIFRDGAFHFTASPFLAGLEEKVNAATVLDLVYKTDFESFSPQYQSDELGSAVVVQGYDPVNASPVYGVYGESIEQTVIAGMQAEISAGLQVSMEAMLSPGSVEVLATGLAQGAASLLVAEGEAALIHTALKAAGDANPGTKISGNSPIFITDSSVDSQPAAELVAVSTYLAKVQPYISGGGSGIGNAGIRAGGFVNLKGLGRRFSGPYYVEKTTHTWNEQNGYTTNFNLKRKWSEELI